MQARLSLRLVACATSTIISLAGSDMYAMAVPFLSYDVTVVQWLMMSLLFGG